jgi:hypothetical protein
MEKNYKALPSINKIRNEIHIRDKFHIEELLLKKKNSKSIDYRQEE